MKKKDGDDLEIPVWLRYVLIVLAILALLLIMTKGTGPFRIDFPVF